MSSRVFLRIRGHQPSFLCRLAPISKPALGQIKLETIGNRELRGSVVALFHMVTRYRTGVAIVTVFAKARRNKEAFDGAVPFPASLPKQIGKFYPQLVFSLKFFS
jgi:hypothetical protein